MNVKIKTKISSISFEESWYAWIRERCWLSRAMGHSPLFFFSQSSCSMFIHKKDIMVSEGGAIDYKQR